MVYQLNIQTMPLIRRSHLILRSGSCQGCMDLVYHGCWLPSCCATSKKPRASGCSVRAHPRLAGVCLVLWAGDGCPAHPFEVTAVACAVPARAAPAGAAAGG
jgi:hypothetical protein